MGHKYGMKAGVLQITTVAIKIIKLSLCVNLLTYSIIINKEEMKINICLSNSHLTGDPHM